MRRTIVSLLCVTGLAGCYHYVPAELDDATPGRDIRLRVTPAEAARFRNLLPESGRILDGTVVQRNPGALLIDVPVASSDLGSRIETLSQRLDVATAGILDVEIRELDRTRTILTVLGTTAVGGAILAAAITRAFGSEPGDEPTPPEDIVVPLFIRIRW